MPYADPTTQREYFDSYYREWKRRRRVAMGMPADGWPEIACKTCSKVFKPHSKLVKYCCTRCRETDPALRPVKSKRRAGWVNATPANYMKSLIKQAPRKRSRANLSHQFVLDLLARQHGLCALTGVKMTFLNGAGYVGTNASIDRIDGAGEYTEDNVRLVCRRVNEMRGTMTDVELKEWCHALVKHSG